MVRKVIGVTGIGLWIGLIALLIWLQATANGDEPILQRLPNDWRIEKSFTASKTQTAAFSSSLGGRISKLTNTIISFKGQRLQVNVIHCSTKTDAEKIYSAVLKGHNGIADYALIDGNLVVEFAKCSDVELARKARRALGLELARLDDVARKLVKKIPAEWQVVDSFIVPDEQANAIGKKLGGRIKKLSNTIFLVQGKRFQVNVIECVTPQDAEEINKKILEMKTDPAFCLKLENYVIEFVSDDVELAKKAATALGIIAGSMPIETMASDLVSSLAGGDYEKAVEDFDELMRNALPAEKLKQVWESIISQSGAFVEQESIRKEKIMGYDVVFVTCKFKRATVDTKVVFNNKRQITGLWFVPPQSSIDK